MGASVSEISLIIHKHIHRNTRAKHTLTYTQIQMERSMSLVSAAFVLVLLLALPRWGQWVLRQGLSQTRQLKGRFASIRAPCSKGCAFRLTTVNTPAERSNSPEAIVVSSPVLVCAPKSAN